MSSELPPIPITVCEFMKKKYVTGAHLPAGSDILTKLYSVMDYWIEEKEKTDDNLFVNVPLEEYLFYCRDKNINFDIYLIEPKGKFKKYKYPFAVFPISFKFKDAKGYTRIGGIKKSVLFKGELHNYTEFFGNKEVLNTERMLSCFEPKTMIKVPFFIASMCPEDFLSLTQDVLTPLRKYFYRWGVIADYRGSNGKTDKIMKQRNRFIINEYKRLGEPKILPINEILYKWRDIVIDKIFPDVRDGAKAEKYYCSEQTVRRMLKNFHKK